MADRSEFGSNVEGILNITKMARLVGLSRSRFYDHMERGVFHKPLRAEGSSRPYYTPELAAANIHVRCTGIGANGSVVSFNDKNRSVGPMLKAPKPHLPKRHRSLIQDLKSLGFTVTAAQVDEALTACFSDGIDGQDEATVLRTLLRHLKKERGV